MLEVGQTFDVYETTKTGGYFEPIGKWGIDLGTHFSSNLVNLLISNNHPKGLSFGINNAFCGVECRLVAKLRITKLK